MAELATQVVGHIPGPPGSEEVMSTTAEFIGGPADGLVLAFSDGGLPPEHLLPKAPPLPRMMSRAEETITQVECSVLVYRRGDADPRNFYYVQERSS